MEPNRTSHRIIGASRRRQAGITAIGFLALAIVFGIVGLAGIKIVPLYLQQMRLSQVLEDLETNLDGTGTTPQGIRNELGRRFSIEGIELSNDALKITQVRDGYQVQIHQESRTPFIANLWFMMVFDEQAEIRR
jgi:hypothetical protein